MPPQAKRRAEPTQHKLFKTTQGVISSGIMSAMRSGVVSSLLRRAFAVRRPPVSTPSSFLTSPICRTTVPAATRSTAERSSCSGGQHVPHQHQRAGLSTLRRGLTGPLSARLRLPMRGLEEFRDPEVVKVRVCCVVYLSTTREGMYAVCRQRGLQARALQEAAQQQYTLVHHGYTATTGLRDPWCQITSGRTFESENYATPNR